MTGKSWSTPERGKMYSSHGGKATAKKTKAQIFIEGEYLTYEQIGARLGRSSDYARKRLSALRTKKLAVNWTTLGAKNV